MPYNPFDKPIGSILTKEDLQRLVEQGVTEGYFVEYKSVFPAKAKIAHSVASLANAYGGWYIVGVKTDQHNVAKEICGFSLKESPDPISKVRDIVKTHLDPVPIFYPQVVTLEEDIVVLLVHVPGDQETPFVVKDGRIYRRNHDSSDPVAETSRYTIDRLVDAGRDFTKRFERFCSDGRTFTEAEERQGWVNLYLSPSPLGTVDKLNWFSHTEIERLLKLSQTPFAIFKEDMTDLKANIVFNVGYPTHQSIILKQVDPENVAFNSLTVELFLNKRAKFFVPMYYDIAVEQKQFNQLESKRVKEVLINAWATNQREFSQVRFLDMGQVSLAIACLLAYYEAWVGKDSWFTELVFGVTINNPSRTIPFFDADEWGDHVQKCGMPVINQKKITVPEDIGHGFPLGWGKEDALPRWMAVCFFIALAFGLPLEQHSRSLGSAVTRAIRKANIASKNNAR